MYCSEEICLLSCLYTTRGSVPLYLILSPIELKRPHHHTLCSLALFREDQMFLPKRYWTIIFKPCSFWKYSPRTGRKSSPNPSTSLRSALKSGLRHLQPPPVDQGGQKSSTWESLKPAGWNLNVLFHLHAGAFGGSASSVSAFPPATHATSPAHSAGKPSSRKANGFSPAQQLLR